MTVRRWEYLTLLVSWSYEGPNSDKTTWRWAVSPTRRKEEYGDQLRSCLERQGDAHGLLSRAGNPIEFVEVLGDDGWELVSVQDRSRGKFKDSFGGDAVFTTGELVAYRMWFKRPVD